MIVEKTTKRRSEWHFDRLPRRRRGVWGSSSRRDTATGAIVGASIVIARSSFMCGFHGPADPGQGAAALRGIKRERNAGRAALGPPLLFRQARHLAPRAEMRDRKSRSRIRGNPVGSPRSSSSGDRHGGGRGPGRDTTLRPCQRRSALRNMAPATPTTRTRMASREGSIRRDLGEDQGRIQDRLAQAGMLVLEARIRLSPILGIAAAMLRRQQDSA